MNDLVTDTEEAIKQERLHKIWHEHGNLIISLVAGVILATAAWSFYSSWDKSQRIASTNTMFEILEDETFPENVTSASALDLPAGLKGLTLLRAAATHLEQKKPQSAQALYAEMIAANDIPANLKDLAVLMDTRVAANQKAPDYQALINALSQITPQSVYYPQSILESAVYSAALNDFETALSTLEIIKETPALPETLYLKAQTLNHIYKLRQQEKLKNQDT